MPGTIMMIDDDPYILDSLDILLQQHGYDTIKADSSKEFQKLFHKHIDLTKSRQKSPTSTAISKWWGTLCTLWA